MMQHRRFNLQQEKTPVNWHRGMFRLWVLVSAAWVMGWALFFAVKFAGGEYSVQQIPALPVVLVGPPFALLLFGLGARWAIRGFETDQPEQPANKETALRSTSERQF